jgi:hypothetical protein
MALLVALVAGVLINAESQASDQAYRSNPQGFLSKYLPLGFDASRTPFDHYDRLITPDLNHRKHGNGPYTLSHQRSPAEHGRATDEAQYLDVNREYGGKTVSNMGDRFFATLHDKHVHPKAQSQNSMGFGAAREESLTRTKEFDLPKTSSNEAEKAVQKLFANGNNNTPITLSAIGVGLLTLVTIFGLHKRRGEQTATVFANSGALESNMSVNMTRGLDNNILEMKSHGLDIGGAATLHTTYTRKERYWRVIGGNCLSRIHIVASHSAVSPLLA